jgi:hypothetical protein
MGLILGDSWGILFSFRSCRILHDKQFWMMSFLLVWGGASLVLFLSIGREGWLIQVLLYYMGIAL